MAIKLTTAINGIPMLNSRFNLKFWGFKVFIECKIWAIFAEGEVIGGIVGVMG